MYKKVARHFHWIIDKQNDKHKNIIQDSQYMDLQRLRFLKLEDVYYMTMMYAMHLVR